MQESRKGPRVNIYFGEVLDDPDNPGVKIHPRARAGARLLRAKRGLGSSGLDYAEMEFDFSVEAKASISDLIGGGLVEDAVLPCRIEVESRETGEAKTIHYGELVGLVGYSNGEADGARLISRAAAHMISHPLVRRVVFVDQEEGLSYGSTERPLVFNPDIDGVIRGNRSKEQIEHLTLDATKDASFETRQGTSYIFYDLESARHERTQDRPDLWRVSDAVHYCVEHLYREEFFSTVPTLDEIREAITQGDPFLETIDNTSLRNVSLPFGVYLPQALDILLSPYGWSWFVEHDGEERLLKIVNTTKPTQQLRPWMPEEGAGINTEEHDTFDIVVNYDISRLANNAYVMGSLIRVEGLFELKKSWPVEYDELDETALNNVDAETGQEDVRKRDAWRKWVLNEAGDYNDLEEREYETYDLTEMLERHTEYASIYPRRRQFLPMLNTRTDGTPLGQVNGVLVQVQLRGSEEWIDLPEGLGVAIHRDECAISFSQATKAFDAVRVVATVEGDSRIRYQTGVDAASVNSDRVTQVLYMPGRFQLSKVDETSPFYQLGVDDDESPAWIKNDTADDSVVIQDFAGEFQNANDTADVIATITLDGIDRYEVDLGYAIDQITGRDIRLNGRSELAEEGFYPIIESMEFSELAQLTTLTCRTNRGAMR